MLEKEKSKNPDIFDRLPIIMIIVFIVTVTIIDNLRPAIDQTKLKVKTSTAKIVNDIEATYVDFTAYRDSIKGIRR